MNPDYAEAYKNRGTVYFQQGQHQRAIADFNGAIRLKHDYAGAYNNRGAAYFAQRNSKLCCNDLQKACELGVCDFLKNIKTKGYCR